LSQRHQGHPEQCACEHLDEEPHRVRHG
jgi:hypothetical protein